MYLTPDPTIIKQGDILSYFYFSFFPKEKLISINSDNQRTEINYSIKINKKEFEIINGCRPSAAIVITRTCNGLRRNYIQVCPVFTIESLKNDLINSGKNEEQVLSIISSVRNNKVDYYFYLPKFSDEKIDFSESYVDLQLVNSIHRGLINKFPRILSLSDKMAHWFSFYLLNYYGKPS